jgi:hypothetical protein
MRKLMLAVAIPAVLTLGAEVTAQAAASTSIHASPSSSAVGQRVTFTATFTSACSGAIKPHYFTIDGQKYFGNLVLSGKSGTESYAISSLAAGTHTVKYYWQTSTASCLGSASTTYTVVRVKATPAASPSPTPSPSASPTPSPIASPTASESPIALVAANETNAPLGYLGGGLLVVALGSGRALALLSRRAS